MPETTSTAAGTTVLSAVAKVVALTTQTNRILPGATSKAVGITVLPAVAKVAALTTAKIVGFTATGIKAGSAAALMQSTFYGGLIAKGSLFANLQSFATVTWFDPTLFTVSLLGGCLYYYFYMNKT